MDRTKDINFKVKGLDGAVLDCSLVPLKQKVAGKVFHTCVSQLVGAIAGALDLEGNTIDQKKVMVGAAKELAKLDYDLLWEVASSLCKDAIINNKEVKSLDEIEELADYPWLLYLIIVNGVKGNWPRVFFSIEAKLKGFASAIQAQMQTVIPTDG